MKRQTSFLMLLGLFMVLAWSAAARSQDEPRRFQPNQVADFMQLKLMHAKKVLEGLAIEDFDMIAKHSQELSLLSQATNWQVLQTDEYLTQSVEFRRAADALTKAAEEKNLDAAALRYMDVTMKCIVCHKYVRGIRMANAQQ